MTDRSAVDTICFDIPIGMCTQRPENIHVVVCGPSCLMNAHDTFVCAVPRPSHNDDLLFKTGATTLIKAKKHPNSRAQTKAFQVLRDTRPMGIAGPLRECHCSYEVPFIEGLHVSPPPILLSPCWHVGRYVDMSNAQALSFIRNARAIMVQLHRLGITHGDPNYRNFMVSNSGVWLIDFDDTTYTGPIRASWELFTFVRGTVLPVLKGRCSIQEIIAEFLCSRDLLGIALGGAAFVAKCSFYSVIALLRYLKT